MTTTTMNNKSGLGLIVLFFFVIFVVAAIIGSLSALPMTKHAAQGRIGTTMDADTIRQMIDDRACQPIEFYVCPSANQSKAICYLKSITNNEGVPDELWAGVIVGLHAPNPIITGYVAPYFEYWIPANTRDGCRLAPGTEQ